MSEKICLRKATEIKWWLKRITSYPRRTCYCDRQVRKKKTHRSLRTTYTADTGKYWYLQNQFLIGILELVLNIMAGITYKAVKSNQEVESLLIFVENSIFTYHLTVPWLSVTILVSCVIPNQLNN